MVVPTIELLYGNVSFHEPLDCFALSQILVWNPLARSCCICLKKDLMSRIPCSVVRFSVIGCACASVKEHFWGEDVGHVAFIQLFFKLVELYILWGICGDYVTKNSESLLVMFSPLNFFKCLTSNNDSNVDLSLFFFIFPAILMTLFPMQNALR